MPDLKTHNTPCASWEPRLQFQQELLVNCSSLTPTYAAQFLPQDKVSSFAALKPEELLRETLTAMGDMDMHDQHQELIKMQAAIRAKESVSTLLLQHHSAGWLLWPFR